MLKAMLSAYGKTVLLTSEVFWIVIFLLERLGGQTAKGIPEFIYVNF
jgi:hypothetical protein